MKINNMNKHVASKLKQYRLANGLTQAELAARAGINTNAYAKIERGERTAVVSTLKKLAKALGVKSSDILPF